MITLLDKLRATEAADRLVLGPRAGALLEWERVTDQIARHCRNHAAAQAVRATRPFTDPEAIGLIHALTDELRPAAEVDQWPPLMNLGEALDLLRQAPPIRLEGSDLVHLAAVCEELDRLRDYFLTARAVCPLWGEAAVQMTTFSGVSGAIRRALDNDGYILDSASAVLGRLRASVTGQEKAVRSEMNRAMSAARSSGWTTGDEITLRGDRFCLPLRSGDSRRIPGIVHDRSATGATLFVEPAGVVRLANDLAETRLEIAAEEARILFELNRAVEQASEPLQEAAELMLRVDRVRAHLLWSRQVQGRRPTVAVGARIQVTAGRHPLLMEALGEGDLAVGRREVVPLDLEIPAGVKALVISGPNAGGKSVALKSVGTFCLLAQCGWDIPAGDDTRLPLIRRLLVDLGDDQSIAQALSSFSAHLSHLAGFLREADAGTLILCDEIGSGTDPQEGTALAFAVLDRLARQGAMVLASTHYGLLKAAVHDHPQMVNAAMDYDETDLRPLFTFRVGDPGTSHAFDIAERMGLPGDLLAQARKLAGHERVQIEQLLKDLDRRSSQLAQQLETASDQTRQLDIDRKARAKRLKGLDAERRKVLAESRDEAKDLIRTGRRSIEQAVKEIRHGGGEVRIVKAARDRLADVDRRLDEKFPQAEDLTVRAGRDVVVEPGMRIRIPHLGLLGRVVEVRGDRLTALADGLRLTVSREAVIPLTEDGNAPAPAPEQAGGWSWSETAPETGHEIDLRGETGEEGWARLDRLIDRSIPAGLEVINVIHGFGTGKLRDHLYLCLKKDPRVARFHEAGDGRGGGGATLVHLKS